MSRLAACTNKHAHLTWLSARRAVRAMRRSRKVHNPLAVYRCRHCGQFHIGGNP